MKRLLGATTLAALLFAVPAGAMAAVGDQLRKLVAADAEEQDRFGGASPAFDDRTIYGVDIDARTAIVGAPGDDTDFGFETGSAYLFDLTTGTQTRQLTPRNAADKDTFGNAVGISGNVAIVGAARNVEGSSSPGTAYLFDVTTGVELFQINAADPVDMFDGFGWSVAMDGDQAIVGAPLHPADGQFVGGSAYLFDVTTGQQLFKLNPDEPVQDDTDWFGISVAISGNNAIIGAWGDNEHGRFSGAAYLYDVSTGEQRFKLTPLEADAFDEFGHAVAIDGNTAVVGAPADDNDKGEFSGLVHVFDVDTGTLRHTLLPDDAANFDRFGWSVAVQNDTILVGATGDRDRGDASGSAYLFDAITGDQLGKMTGDDTASEDNFGWSVAIDGDRALVSAPFSDDACSGNPQCESGSAYVFDVADSQLMAGDANQDLAFDQLDIVSVSQAGKYLTGQPATWSQGDWNGAPGGSPGSPPAGDGVFDQRDIVAALSAGIYLTGPYAALQAGGQPRDGQTSIVYDASTGQLAVDAPAGTQLTSIHIDSASGIFTGDAAENLGGSFDNDADNNIFKATFGSSFASLSFGKVVEAGLEEPFLLRDLTIVGSLAGGGGLGEVDLIYIAVPEPSAVLLLVVGLAVLFVSGSRVLNNGTAPLDGGGEAVTLAVE